MAIEKFALIGLCLKGKSTSVRIGSCAYLAYAQERGMALACEGD